MITSWVLALIPMVLVLVFSIFARSKFNSWLHPGAYFSLLVTLYFGLPLIMIPDFYIVPGAMWWIMISTLSFMSGSISVTFVYEKELTGTDCTSMPDEESDSEGVEISKTREYDFPYIRAVLIASIALGMLSTLFLVVLYGESLSGYFSLEGAVNLGSAFSKLRYGGDYNPPFVVQALLPFVYLSPVIGGILMAVRKNGKQLALALLSLFPALLGYITSTARAGLLAAIILFISGYFVYQVLRGVKSRYRVFSKYRLPLIIMILFITLLVYSYGDIARTGELPTISKLNDALSSPRASSYIFGHSPAYSQWFQGAWGTSENPRFGAETFNGFLWLMGQGGGSPENPSGDMIYIASDKKTNIYGIFRGLARDFTFGGSLIFLFLLGIATGALYFKVGQGSLLLMPLLAAAYAFLGMQVTSVFRFTSTVAAFILFQAYITFVHIIVKREERETISSKEQMIHAL